MRSLGRYLFPLVFVSLPLMAQPQQMGEQQLQALMQGAMQMQACIAYLDEKKLEAMGNKAQAVEKEVKALCASGERDAAQEKAIATAIEFANSDEVQPLKTCGDIARALMPELLAQIEQLEEEGADTSNHVCDNL